MNIFYLDSDPVLAAEYQCDKHVVKMILESAQLLCTAHHELDSGKQHTESVKFYKATHKNHPCAIWARSSKANYKWLARHAQALTFEYTRRYNKAHASTATINYCADNNPVPDGDFTPPAQAMPDEYKNPCAITAYRDYYRLGKSATIDMKWKPPSCQPSWYWVPEIQK